MRLTTFALLALIGVALVHASPAKLAEKKENLKIDEIAEQKDRFKKSLTEQGQVEKGELQIKEAGEDKERAKKSTTTFCVEIRPGASEPTRTVCGCDKDKPVQKAEVPVPEPAPLPEPVTVPAPVEEEIKPEPIPAPRPEPIREEQRPQVTHVVHVVKPAPRPQPQYIQVLRPEPEPQPQTHHIVHVVPKPQPQPAPQPCTIQVVKPQPIVQPPPIQIVRPQPIQPPTIQIVKPHPAPEPCKVHVIEEQAPQPAQKPRPVVNIIHAAEPVQETTYHVVKPQPAPQPEPCEIHHYVQPAAKPAKIVNIVNAEPAPLPNPQASLNVLPVAGDCQEKQPVVVIPSNPVVFYPHGPHGSHGSHGHCHHHPFVQCDCHTKGSYRSASDNSMQMMGGMMEESEGPMNSNFRNHHRKQEQKAQPIILYSQPADRPNPPVTVQCNPSIVPLSDTPTSDYYISSSARSSQQPMMDSNERNTYLSLHTGSFPRPGGYPPTTYGGNFPSTMGYPPAVGTYPPSVIPAGISIHSYPGIYRNSQAELHEQAMLPEMTYVTSNPSMIYETDSSATNERRAEGEMGRTTTLEAQDMMRSTLKVESLKDDAKEAQERFQNNEDFQPFMIIGPRSARSNEDESKPEDKSRDKGEKKPEENSENPK